MPRAAEPRYLHRAVAQDLAKKMVFLSGPRQVGKTTLAKTILGKEEDAADQIAAYLMMRMDRDVARHTIAGVLYISLWLVVRV